MNPNLKQAKDKINTLFDSIESGDFKASHALAEIERIYAHMISGMTAKTIKTHREQQETYGNLDSYEAPVGWRA